MTREYRASRIIDAPPATIWRLLADAGTYDDWNDAIVHIDGAIREGETIRLVSVVDPKRTFTPRVTEMQAPLRMVWSDGMPFGLFTGERTYTIVDRGGHRSEFTMVEQFTGPLAGLITRAMPDLTDSFQMFANSLKAAAESRA